MGLKMKLEITEIEYPNSVNGNTICRYELFIDNVLIATNCVQIKQEPIRIYEYFLKLLIKEWKTKYKRIYEEEYGKNHHNGQERFNPKTIVREEIQDINLTLKQAQQFVREQKLHEDFV